MLPKAELHVHLEGTATPDLVRRRARLVQREQDPGSRLHRAGRRHLRQPAAGGALAAALLFGFSSALAQRLPELSPSTATLFQALPNVLTLIAVAGFIGRSRPPAAVSQPYVKE